LDFTETRESGFLRFWLSKNQHPLVGASLLEMDVNESAGQLKHRVVLSFFASKPAPPHKNQQCAFEKQYRLSLLQVFAMRQ
jgi:hypothetical protein